MTLLMKFTGRASGIGQLSEWQKTLCPTIKRHCSEKDVTGEREAQSDFRVLKVTPTKKDLRGTRGSASIYSKLPPKDIQYGEDVDWTNIWVGPKSFDPYLVPLPLRQGYVKKGVPPGKYANTELMKIPNFLHLTPPAIKKHCKALKKFCTKWPETLTKETMDKHFPVTVIASDYCHSSPSIRDPLSRVVTVKVMVDALDLDKHAKDKLLRLVGDRYNPKRGILTITTTNCPLKKQNYNHAMYILTALCFESWKVEDWEKLKTIEDLETYSFDLRKTKTNVEAYFDYTKKPCPSLENIRAILEKYLAEKEDMDVINSMKEEVLKLLNLPKFA